MTICTLALSFAGAPTAQAASVTFVDGPGDVWHMGPFDQTRTPHRSQGDILRAVYDHRQRQVVIRYTFAQLKRAGQGIRIDIGIRSPGLQDHGVVLFAGPEQANNRWRGQATFGDPQGPVACATTHNIDYATNVAVIRIPRTCLNHPRTVQIKSRVRTFTRRRHFADNPNNHGPSLLAPPYTDPIPVG